MQGNISHSCDIHRNGEYVQSRSCSGGCFQSIRLSHSSQVDAIYKTPITLPVKERVAEGLSRAGTSNTLKLVLYNSILGVIAFFSFGAVRQFCAFAIVVLVAHWFLAHVFFTAVLSIDLQRLEV